MEGMQRRMGNKKVNVILSWIIELESSIASVGIDFAM